MRSGSGLAAEQTLLLRFAPIGALGVVDGCAIHPAAAMVEPADPVPSRKCPCERLGHSFCGEHAVADDERDAVGQACVLGSVPGLEVTFGAGMAGGRHRGSSHRTRKT